MAKFIITREVPLPWFNVELENGHTETLEPEEARTFFRLRGARMEVVENVLDWAWNLGHYKPYVLEIENYREPVVNRGKADPKV